MKKQHHGTEQRKAWQVDVSTCWKGWAKHRTAAELEEIELKLLQMLPNFGQPHLHSGIGLRRLRQNIYEFRISKGIRVLFVFHKPNRIHLAMTGNHDQVRTWLMENA